MNAQLTEAEQERHDAQASLIESLVYDAGVGRDEARNVAARIRELVEAQIRCYHREDDA